VKEKRRLSLNEKSRNESISYAVQNSQRNARLFLRLTGIWKIPIRESEDRCNFFNAYLRNSHCGRGSTID